MSVACTMQQCYQCLNLVASLTKFCGIPSQVQNVVLALSAAGQTRPVIDTPTFWTVSGQN